MVETETVLLRKCSRCGKLFPAKAYLRLCDSCRIIYEAERNPKPKICIDCGQPFFSRSSRCQKCNKKLKAEKKALSQISRVCLWCQKQFSTNKPNQKFCSYECREQFSSMTDKIGKRSFELDFLREMAKLEELGKNYVIPERKEEFEEDLENEE